MYYKLNEKELEYLKKVANITITDYEVKGDFIQVDNLMTALEDLLTEYNNLEEQFEDFKQNVEDNYKRISQKEMYE